MHIGSPTIGGRGRVTMRHEEGVPAEQELGVTGVELYAGDVTSEDHVPELRGKKWLAVAEKMLRTDAMVFATYIAIELTLREAELTIRPSDEDSPEQQEWAEILQKNFLEDLTGTWDCHVQQAALQFPFGFMLFEKILKLEDGMYLLDNLAPRHPRTVDKWALASKGELLGVWQDAWVSGNHIVKVPSTEDQYLRGAEPEIEKTRSTRETIWIPGWKLLKYTFRETSGNPTGTSVLRSAYPHWFIKQRLYRYDAMAHERMSVGVPIMKLPEQYSQQDIQNAQKMLRNWHAQQNAYAILPHNFELEMMDMHAEGAKNPLESIHHHDRMIGVNMLQTFLTLGDTTVGSRALADPLIDMFFVSLQGGANHIANALSRGVIAPLTEINHGPNFPPPVAHLTVQKRVSFEDLADRLPDLVDKGVVTAGDEIEAHVRHISGLPMKPIDDAGDKEDLEPEGGDEEESPDTAGPEPGTEPELQSGRTAIEDPEGIMLSDDAPLPEWLPRAPVGPERFMALDEIRSENTGIEEALANDVGAWMKTAGAVLAKDIAAGEEDALQVAGLSNRGDLQVLIEEHLRKAFAYGRQTVAEEIARQRLASGRPVQTVRLDDKIPEHLISSKKASKLLKGLSKALRTWAEARVLDAAIQGGASGTAQGLTGKALEELVTLRVALLSEKMRLDRVREAVRPAFVRGRAFEAEQLAEIIARTFYSSILDENTCDPCATTDATFGPGTDGLVMGSTEYYNLIPPNPNCDGWHRCRCVMVYGAA